MTIMQEQSEKINLAPSNLSVSLIIPAYNEVKCIRRTVEEAITYFELMGCSFEIIVSADGDDGTRELVQEMSRTDNRLQVIGSKSRKGKGFGIRSAIERAKGDIIGFTDADNKTRITEFSKIVPAIFNGYDIVIGSRTIAGATIEKPQKWYRRIGGRGFGLFAHAVVGMRDIVDTQCGFKFFTREAAKELFSLQKIDGYMFDLEILYLARRLGLKILQVPINWRDDGDSRLQLVSGNIRNGLDVLRILFMHRGQNSGGQR